ncbi:hypothetical protein [Methylomonas albis]|uniref:Uncharacterized protein n=1 Tax=Methylomonas albis TaxID=1854563 RepID=A0ABR9D6F4_9GAMM|nr:hypothetical protein [Methylomonas albis]MBD9358697.1 hypothetical protein [Methylomonas albis]
MDGASLIHPTALAESSDENVQIVKMPSVANIISPIVYTVPLQLLS